VKPLLALWKKRKLFIIDSFLVLFGFIYFLFFVNKGIVLSDEGYYLHYAERIASGQVPYKDFVLQYTPAYFYLLALLYKIFGAQILVGRFLSVFFCMGILFGSLVLLKLYKIKSVPFHILSGLTLIALGYPLLHVPIVIWSCVLYAMLLVIFYIIWHREKRILFIFLLSTILAVTLLTKQNVGFVFIILINGLVLMSENKDWKKLLQLVFFLNIVWVLFISLLIFTYWATAGNISGILAMFRISKQFIDTYPFTYPPLTYLFEPTGIFKLLPYYYPIIYFILVIYTMVKKKINWEKCAFALVVLSGFFVTVYPASDLIHVYPFLGISLVSSLVFFYKEKFYIYIAGICMVFILMGLYLTFFTKSYRYEGYFLKETTPLNLPKTKGILVDYSDRGIYNIPPLYKFIQQHTKKNDYIFVYPFSPMLYFLLDRQNPTGIVQFQLLEAPDSVYSENRVLREIKNKRVKYIIGAGPYINDKKISKFIQQQKKVYTAGPFVVYEIR
jgi:hypothetical protein